MIATTIASERGAAAANLDNICVYTYMYMYIYIYILRYYTKILSYLNKVAISTIVIASVYIYIYIYVYIHV